MCINFKEIGSKIRKAREHKGMTQERLSNRIGVSNIYISNIERNKSIPSIETLVKICNALEITPNYVLMNSICESQEPIKGDLANKLKKCNNKSIILISKITDLVLEIQNQY